MSVFVSGATVPPLTGTKASDLEVGSSVFLNINGSPTEFLVVQQGNPDPAIYDASCDGVWLLAKYLYENKRWNNTLTNDYANSEINGYLNGDFFNLFGAKEQEAIKPVKIPYRPGSGAANTVSNGANGLDVKVFLLSGAEVSFVNTQLPSNEGAELDYFAGCDDSAADPKRVASREGYSATYWYMRSPRLYAYYSDEWAVCANSTGAFWNGARCSDAHGIRPCVILPNTAVFNPSTFEFKGVA